MQIDDTNVGTMTSEEVAQVLRKAGNPVRLVIARVITDTSGELPPTKPVVSLVYLSLPFIEMCMDIFDFNGKQQNRFYRGIIEVLLRGVMAKEKR